MGIMPEEAIEILEEVEALDDSIYAYNPAYSEAINLAIEALKAQKPIVPKRVVRGAIVQWRCGACDARLGDCLMGDIDNYCRHCGRAVKWNG